MGDDKEFEEMWEVLGIDAFVAAWEGVNEAILDLSASHKMDDCRELSAATKSKERLNRAAKSIWDVQGGDDVVRLRWGL